MQVMLDADRNLTIAVSRGFWQRLSALFLLVVMVVGAAVPPMSAYAATRPTNPTPQHKNVVDDKTKMKTN